MGHGIVTYISSLPSFHLLSIIEEKHTLDFDGEASLCFSSFDAIFSLV